MYLLYFKGKRAVVRIKQADKCASTLIRHNVFNILEIGKFTPHFTCLLIQNVHHLETFACHLFNTSEGSNTKSSKIVSRLFFAIKWIFHKLRKTTKAIKDVSR